MKSQIRKHSILLAKDIKFVCKKANMFYIGFFAFFRFSMFYFKLKF